MKRIKFKHIFVKEILEGKKSDTWRLFDDKNFEINDQIELVDVETGTVFARAVISELEEKKIKNLTEEELRNHGYENIEKMIEGHTRYYGNRVNQDTDLKIIKFVLLD